VVVVAEEGLAEDWCIDDGAETIGEGGAVLEGLEGGLAERVVVADMRPGVGAADAEVGKQLGARAWTSLTCPDRRGWWGVPLFTSWPATARAMKDSASSADSPGATIQSTT